MVEPIYEKILDCATEWIMSGGKATFLGVSVFEASGRGKYHRNIKANQLSLWNMIGVLTQQVIDKQRYALQSVIGTDYDGPVGIDMLLTSTGTLHPCVELNLRRTMGHVALSFNQTQTAPRKLMQISYSRGYHFRVLTTAENCYPSVW